MKVSKLVIKTSRFAVFSFIFLLGMVPASSSAQPFEVLPGGDEVLDQATGLIWSRCSRGYSWDSVNKSCDVSGSTQVYTHQQALEFPQPNDKRWRLPNIKELSTIVDRANFRPSIDAITFPSTRFLNNNLATTYWSATPNVQVPDTAYGIFFTNGGIFLPSRSTPGFVRWVREQ